MIGVDFGTSNTVVSSENNSRSELVVIEDNSFSIPSVIYFGENKQYAIGKKAINLYAEKIRTKQDKKYIRLIQAIKLALLDVKLVDTMVNGEKMLVENIVSLFLHQLFTQISASLKQNEEIIIGRPVRIAKSENEEKQIIDRYKRVFELINIRKYHFVYEPVAASVSLVGKYEGILLIFDFGGGTLDLSIVEIINDKVTILGSDGLEIGGYTIDEDIAKEIIRPRLGYQSKFKTITGKMLEVPNYITNQVISHKLLPSHERKNIIFTLKDIISESVEKDKLRGLLDFMENSRTFELYSEIDNRKIELSSMNSTIIKYSIPPYISVDDEITREYFDIIIFERLLSIRKLILALLEKVGLAEKDIDHVIRVGGSSEIPAVKNMLHELFPGKVKGGDIFSSIAVGLIPAYKRGLEIV